MGRPARWGLALSGGLFMAVVAASGGGCEKKADAGEGRDLFASACARCHGREGTGGLPVFDGGPSPRNFRDHVFQGARTDEQIKLTIMNGKNSAMPAFGTTFTDTQLDALVLHVRGFDPERQKK